MCGIAGVFNPLLPNAEGLAEVVHAMASQLHHRGPDDNGVWTDVRSGVALGHTRLSILDLSSEGSQPMHSSSGDHCLTFNGEIYNFGELRADLEARGHRFRGHSDTEVMLAAFDEWGVDHALERFNGMFAFALWDRKSGVLHLARDRFGEKPLYYTSIARQFIFGSELKALQAHPAFNASIDRDALNLYLQYGYIPAPHTIYARVYKLPAGHKLSITSDSTVKLTAYWSASRAAAESLRSPFSGSYMEAEEELDHLLRIAVHRRMQSDVPIGAFLSGGIDSSVVVALMQAQSRRSVETFSIGSPDPSSDEAPYARAIAGHLGTTHREMYVSPEQAQSVIPDLPRVYDEPFSDASQIPTLLVSELARRHVTVALSGDGGDELFGGYTRYFRSRTLWKAVDWVPRRLRPSLGRAIGGMLPEDHDASPDSPMAHVRRRLRKIGKVISSADAAEIYGQVTAVWPEPERVTSVRVTDANDRGTHFKDVVSMFMCMDTQRYLPDDILVKLDRASMKHSLEARVPLLDTNVFSFAWSLPADMKVRNGEGKRILRSVLARYVPVALFTRPKKGFRVPVGEWLRGPLRPWAEDLLSEHRLGQDAYFNASVIRQCWSEHVAGTSNWKDRLWNILMFQAWLRNN